jgi:hypothetical protein
VLITDKGIFKTFQQDYLDIKILKYMYDENFEILNFFENFDLFWQIDWPTGNEISSLVGQR